MKGTGRPKHFLTKAEAVFQHRADFRPSFPTRHSWATFASRGPFRKCSAGALSKVTSRATALLRSISTVALGAHAIQHDIRIRQPCLRRTRVFGVEQCARLHSMPAALANARQRKIAELRQRPKHD